MHIVTHSHAGSRWGILPRYRGGITRQQAARRLDPRRGAARRWSPLALASSRSGINLTSDVLAFLVAVIAVALVGGFLPAVVEAIAASLLLNYYFTPPIHYWTIAEANNCARAGRVRRRRRSW